MTFIGATKIKHIAADQIKTTFGFSFNATRSNTEDAEDCVATFTSLVKARD